MDALAYAINNWEFSILYGDGLGNLSSAAPTFGAVGAVFVMPQVFNKTI